MRLIGRERSDGIVEDFQRLLPSMLRLHVTIVTLIASRNDNCRPRLAIAYHFVRARERRGISQYRCVSYKRGVAFRLLWKVPGERSLPLATQLSPL